MNMNEETIKSMGKMITAMLPYELGYQAKSNSTSAIAEIFMLLREKNPKIDEFEGFLGFVLKKMDSENTDEMDKTLMEIWAIINKHYPPIED